ncbi:MAG: hypothetical protein Q8Q09_26235 [Deltaproteobacteria bacterium]|nr:hypothetical protein [Deltaproteobacteria bacterium]
MRAPSRRLTTALLIASVVITVTSRALIEGHRELARGEQALAQGATSDAIRALRRSAHWYLPFSPFTRRAYEQLEHIATTAEGQGRNDQALSAWRAIRASALATRWLIVPERERLDRANRHLAALMAELPPPPEDRLKDRTRLREEHLALLQEDRAPDPAWLVVLALGFAVWLAGLYRTLTVGFDDQDRPQRRALWLSIATVLGGLAMVLTAIARA